MWRRTLAFLIDLVPLAILAAIENILGIADNIYVGLVNFLFLISYFAGMNYLYGGTIGKRYVGLRVALPSTPNVLVHLVIRAFVKILCLVPPMILVSAFMVIWRSDGRSLPDLASGSTVVEVPSLTPPKPATQTQRVCATLLIVFSPVIFGVLVLLGLFAWLVIDLVLEILSGLWA